MAHGTSFAKLLALTKRAEQEAEEEQEVPLTAAELKLWRRLMDPNQTSIRQFLEAKDVKGEPIFRIATKEIQADGTVMVPLRLWPNQVWLLENIEEMWSQGHAAKLYLPKDREQGISFIIQAIFAVMFLRGGGGHMRTVSHKEEATKSLCEDFNAILACVPAQVYREILGATWVSRREGRWKLSLPKRNLCVAKTMTCRDGAMGRGDRLRWFHLSEMPWWPRGQKTVKGALTTLRDTPGNIYIFESTGKGFDDFYQGCMAAVEGKSDWRCLFFSALTHPAKRVPFKNSEERVELERTLGQKADFDMDGEMRWDRECRRVKMADEERLERLNWRRKQIAGPLQGDVEMLAQEHPICLSDVFRLDSDSVFDSAILDEWREPARIDWENWERGEFEITGTTGDVPVRWHADRAGRWWVRKQPIKGHMYCWGADPASGKKVVERGKMEADYATCLVRDVTSKEFVAYFRAHVPPEDFALIVLGMSKVYGWARGYPEANNDGKVFLSVNVMPLYEDRWETPVEIVLAQVRITFQEGKRIFEKVLGWYTHSDAKHATVIRAKRFVREMKVPSERPGQLPLPLILLDEMQYFTAQQTTSKLTGGTTGHIAYGAQSGHDDMVTSFLLCLEAEAFLEQPEHEAERTQVQDGPAETYNQAILAKARRELGLDEPVAGECWQPKGTFRAGAAEEKRQATIPGMGSMF